MKLIKISSGGYRTADGRFAIQREDHTSEDEYGNLSGARERLWFVVKAEHAGIRALPDSLFEAPTMRECTAWTVMR